MTIYRLPDPETPAGYIYLHELDIMGVPPDDAEEGVWCPTELFTHLILIQAAARVAATGEPRAVELEKCLDAYDVYRFAYGGAIVHDPAPPGLDPEDEADPALRYEVRQVMPVGLAGAWYDVIDTHAELGAPPMFRRKTRERAEDDAGALNYGSAYRPTP